jgi:hypothetical protein
LFPAVAAKGCAKWATAQGLAGLTPVFVCIAIAFSPHTVALVCLVPGLLSETDNNEEGFGKFLITAVGWLTTIFRYHP